MRTWWGPASLSSASFLHKMPLIHQGVHSFNRDEVHSAKWALQTPPWANPWGLGLVGSEKVVARPEEDAGSQSTMYPEVRKLILKFLCKSIHVDGIYILFFLHSLSFCLRSKWSSDKMEACWFLSSRRVISGKFGKRMLWRNLCIWRSKRSIWKWRDHCM